MLKRLQQIFIEKIITTKDISPKEFGAIILEIYKLILRRQYGDVSERTENMIRNKIYIIWRNVEDMFDSWVDVHKNVSYEIDRVIKIIEKFSDTLRNLDSRPIDEVIIQFDQMINTSHIHGEFFEDHLNFYDEDEMTDNDWMEAEYIDMNALRKEIDSLGIELKEIFERKHIYAKPSTFDEFILERDFREFVDKVVENLIDTRGIEEYIEEIEYLDYENASEIESEEEKESIAKEYLWEIASDNLLRFEHDFENLAEYQDEKLVLYRELTFKGDYKKHLQRQGKHLGIYWTFHEGSAEAHWGHFLSGSQSYTLIGLVDEKTIDWAHTYILNGTDPDEREIRLVKGSPIQLIELKNNEGEELDISQFKGRVFYA